MMRQNRFSIIHNYDLLQWPQALMSEHKQFESVGALSQVSQKGDNYATREEDRHENCHVEHHFFNILIFLNNTFLLFYK